MKIEEKHLAGTKRLLFRIQDETLANMVLKYLKEEIKEQGVWRTRIKKHLREHYEQVEFPIDWETFRVHKGKVSFLSRVIHHTSSL